MRYLILLTIRNSEVSTIEGRVPNVYGYKGTHSVLPKQRAIQWFQLKGKSVKGGSTVVFKSQLKHIIYYSTKSHICLSISAGIALTPAHPYMSQYIGVKVSHYDVYKVS